MNELAFQLGNCGKIYVPLLRFHWLTKLKCNLLIVVLQVPLELLFLAHVTNIKALVVFFLPFLPLILFNCFYFFLFQLPFVPI